jgi:hypothetical protein
MIENNSGFQKFFILILLLRHPSAAGRSQANEPDKKSGSNVAG